MWTPTLFKDKVQALLIHVGISALIFLPFLYLIWVHWFPPPLFFTDGGWQGVRIMLFVDVVIGPTLTFLIFNPQKSRRETLFDFGCIGLVQAAALVYGYVSVESQRIQAVAFSENGFHAVPQRAFAEQSITPDAWARLGTEPPHWVFVREPETAEEQTGILTWELTEGVPRHELEFLYEPVASYWSQVKAQSVQPDKAKSQSPKDARYAHLCDEARTRTQDTAAAVCLRLFGYYRPAVLWMDQSGRLLSWSIGRYD